MIGTLISTGTIHDIYENIASKCEVAIFSRLEMLSADEKKTIYYHDRLRPIN